MRIGIRAENSSKRKFLSVIGLDIKIVMHFHEKRAPPTVDRFFTFFWEKKVFQQALQSRFNKVQVLHNRTSSFGSRPAIAAAVLQKQYNSNHSPYLARPILVQVHVLQMSVIFELMWKKKSLAKMVLLKGNDPGILNTFI